MGVERKSALDLDMLLAEAEDEPRWEDDGAGERLLAMGGRIRGPERARAAAANILSMARSSGWFSDRPKAYLLAPGAVGSEQEGRGFALKGSAADAMVILPGADPDAVNTHPLSEPESATEVEPIDGGCQVRVMYLASGPGADGFEELAQALRDEGIDVTD